MDGHLNNPEKSSKTEVGEYAPSGFLMSTTSSFKDTKNKQDVHRGDDCMKKFCECLNKASKEDS